MFGMRVAPADLRDQRTMVLAERIRAKSEVFSQYKAQDFRTVLIIETDDIALSDRFTICEDFQKAVKIQKPAAIDDVFLIETDTRPWCVTPLKVGNELMVTPNPSWPTAPGYPFLPA
jgi:hypothetical protein